MSTFVDTSALYALLDRRDDNHEPAANALRALGRAEPLQSHNYVVLETTALVQRRLGAPAVRAFLKNITPRLQLVWVDEGVHRAAVSALLGRAGARVSLVDWVSFEVMRRRGIEAAFTFDGDFARHGFETLP